MKEFERIKKRQITMEDMGIYRRDYKKIKRRLN
jgi:hypothetical protein